MLSLSASKIRDDFTREKKTPETGCFSGCGSGRMAKQQGSVPR